MGSHIPSDNAAIVCEDSSRVDAAASRQPLTTAATTRLANDNYCSTAVSGVLMGKTREYGDNSNICETSRHETCTLFM